MAGDRLDVVQLCPSSKLYWAVNPATLASDGTVTGPLHALLTTGVAGAAGKMTALDTGLWAQAVGAVVPCRIFPHDAASTYRVLIE